MALPQGATDALNGAMTDTTDFMQSFSTAYLEAFVKKKLDDLMNDAASTALPGAPELSVDAFIGGGDDGGDDAGEAGGDEATEEKEADDEKETPPIAAGVALVNFRLLYGPDKVQHRYYDIAAVAVKPQGSVIRRVTRTHGRLLREHPELLQSPNAPQDVPFPKKKWGKKPDEYYKARFEGMQTFYESISSTAASLEDPFLIQFDLKVDEGREERLEIFTDALSSVCEEKGIDLEAPMDRAEEIGIDSEEVELLKLVLVEVIGGPAEEKIGDEIRENAPGFLPEKLKNRMLRKTGQQVNAGIGTAVETSWAAMKPVFEAAAEAIQKALDTALEPIATLINKAAEPIGAKIKEKFGDGEPSEPSIGRDVVLDRYPWVMELFGGCESGSAAAALKTFKKKVGTFSNKPDYTGYLVYDFGPDWVRELDLPYLEDVADPHELLVDALLEAWIVLSAGGVEALEPIFAFKDTAASNFDANTFQDGLRNAVREGAVNLAKKYFDLPKKLRRAVWRLGKPATSVVLKLAQKTVEAMIDGLGQFATAWNPQNAAEVTPMFIDSMKVTLQTFGNLTASRFLTTILISTQMSLVNLAMGELGGAIADVAGTLDDLVSGLPEPMGEYLKPGDICTSILTKMIFKAAFFGISKIAQPVHDTFYNVGGVRRTMLRVESGAGAASGAASPRAAAAHEAAEDAGNNTSDEDNDDDDVPAGEAGATTEA